jgi:hypothetical protein
MCKTVDNFYISAFLSFEKLHLKFFFTLVTSVEQGNIYIVTCLK